MPFKYRLNDIKSVIIGECEEWSKEIFVRMWCAPSAHTVRTSCAPKCTFAETLQTHCKGTAIALQTHCKDSAVPLQLIFTFVQLYIAVILLHLRKHQN